MGYALVGSLGPVATGTSGGALGSGQGLAYGQTPTAGNLLIMWWAGLVKNGGSNQPAGWTRLGQAGVGTVATVGILFKVAAGGDAVPTINGTSGQTQSGMLGEFSGNSAAPNDQGGSNNATTTSPVVAALAAADAKPGELVVYVGGIIYSVAVSNAGVNAAVALNNGATAHDTTNNSTSTADHYDFGYGITTGNSAADSASLSYATTSLTGAVLAANSFKLASLGQQLMMMGVGN